MRGVILAGGAATRLPNKPLLPMLNGKPVVTSGLDYLIRSGCTEIVAVVPPNSAVIDILDQVVPGMISWVVQDEPTGVIDAMRLAMRDFVHEPVLFVCADNVYPDTELCREKTPHYTVRRVPAWRRASLTVRGDDGILRRGGSGQLAVTTPWAFYCGQLSMNTKSVESVLMQVNPIERGAGWWDIGTPSAYTAYLRQGE